MELPSFLRRSPHTIKTVVLSFTSADDLNKQILSLQAEEIVDIIPYKTTKTDMGDSQVLSSVLIVLNHKE